MLKKIFLLFFITTSTLALKGMELLIEAGGSQFQFEVPPDPQMIEPYRNFTLALKTDDDNLVKSALAAGANPRVLYQQISPNLDISTKKMTLLHFAAIYGCLKIAQLLLNHNVPVDILDAGNLTPLKCAIVTNKASVVKLLLANNAEVSLQISRGLHLLIKGLVNQTHFSLCRPGEAENNALDIIYLLRRHGIDVKYQDAHKNTPFHLAAPNARFICSLMVPRTARDIEQREIERRARDQKQRGWLNQIPAYISSFFAKPHRVSVISKALKLKARSRVCTFLWVLKTLEMENQSKESQLPHLPREIIERILSHMPIECVYGELESKVVPLYVDRITFRNQFLDEALPQMHVLRSEDTTGESQHFFCEMLQLKNQDNKTALDIARDAANDAIANGQRINPHVMHVLDPATWKPEE